jgi:hypothetical protein
MTLQRTTSSALTATLAATALSALATTASAQITITTTTTAFTDISGTGTSPGTASDDGEFNVSAAQLTTAGFAGNQLLGAVNIRIGNNGSVLWNNTAGEVGYINSTIFGTMATSNNVDTGNGGTYPGTQMVCPLWDDNFPSAGQTANALDWQVISGNLIIQWSFEDHYNAQGTGTVQYEMIVHGGATIASGQPLVTFVYNDTMYSNPAYQNDGGSATIGYKNWGVVAAANDVQFGLGGGTDSLGDPVYAGTNMQPKVGGWTSAADPLLPHALVIKGGGQGAVVYCTAGTSSNGCVPSISASGTPSASAASGFTLSASSIEGVKQGLFFYGISGQVAVPWGTGNSFLCVKAPTQRMNVQSSGGTVGMCNGALSQDWLAFIAANPGSLGAPFAAGNVVDAQGWYRDPPSAKTTNLTNGVEFTVVP